MACDLSDVGVSYGGRPPALRDVSLGVAPGETVAILGPSGAGKSTLLRAVAGSVPLSAGRVALFGEDVTALPRARRARAVGLLPQRFDLVPQLSARNNIHAGALGRWGMARTLAALVLPLEDPVAREVAERLGVAHLLARRVAALSGGEQQRVALARLLVQGPSIVLADEPVASLDPSHAEDVLTALAALARERGRTLITSLHVPELVRRHADRVIGLRGGRLLFDAPARTLQRRHLQALYGRTPVAGEIAS